MIIKLKIIYIYIFISVLWGRETVTTTPYSKWSRCAYIPLPRPVVAWRGVALAKGGRQNVGTRWAASSGRELDSGQRRRSCTSGYPNDPISTLVSVHCSHLKRMWAVVSSGLWQYTRSGKGDLFRRVTDKPGSYRGRWAPGWARRSWWPPAPTQRPTTTTTMTFMITSVNEHFSNMMLAALALAHESVWWTRAFARSRLRAPDSKPIINVRR